MCLCVSMSVCVCQCVRFIEFRINALTFLQVSRGGGKSLHTSRRKSCADFKTRAKLMQHTQHVTTDSVEKGGEVEEQLVCE